MFCFSLYVDTRPMPVSYSFSVTSRPRQIHLLLLVGILLCISVYVESFKSVPNVILQRGVPKASELFLDNIFNPATNLSVGRDLFVPSSTRTKFTCHDGSKSIS